MLIPPLPFSLALRFSRGRAALRRIDLADDTGAATAEYAVVIMAGVAFAGVLVSIVRSGQVQAMLTDLVQKALTVA
ncbi:DUF4244 domain-containing protein [Frondihabitans sp. VKM Ac-2883]|uniref:DUF4244 domain-containing protein n=1 Tax=Frondihabitans sp. VKM Ac-2883 TaxID=2783823 RepID=UPI00188D57EF|nr:DUF4244 domain-containing protein [Frondihabitans sp. VKM Ac-2883]